MDTTHAIAVVVGACLATPLAIMFGVWLARGDRETETRVAYCRGRTSAFWQMGEATDDGARLFEEMAAAYEAAHAAEWSRHE